MHEGFFAETLAELRGLHGPALGSLRVERAVVGAVFSGVKLSDGRGGMAATPRRQGAAAAEERGQPPPGALRGVSVLELLSCWPREPFARSLALAALSALSAPWLDERRYRAVFDRDALELVRIAPGAAVTIVGAFHRYIDRLRGLPGIRLRVLELRPETLRPEDMPLFVPVERAGQALADCDVLLITGLTLANMTLGGLLDRAKPGTRIAVVGPSASILPDALFRRRVSLVGGGVLTDPDAALELMSQGAHARHLYASCSRRVNLFPR
ncbi:MAG: DUF364 domain-containing protein [Elusimicrobia bacterium]|nr:DUF364 domain-containing protein [Elusimicrobiota bacterium]